MCFLVLALFSCGNRIERKTSDTNKDSSTIKKKNYSTKIFPGVVKDLIKLVNSYPDFLDSADKDYLYWKDGTKMVWDDEKKKSFDYMLDNPDLEDMLSIRYPEGRNWNPPPSINFDPGRIRNEEFFKKMYGRTEGDVRKNCVTIDWFGTPVLVSNINGIDTELKQVIKELQKLPSEFHKYFTRTGGTFYWRYIKNTERLSAHSFGAAIDINTEYSDYWEWSKDIKYKNRIPIEIVEIFEKHGFIWGGKWYHYDTMHFEYRPELLSN
ncbi:MAG: M15 family metallopeptidase [Ignavibacteria bacterium]|nr:M15 family metallopeptidase [Ignavibacteria bacterium]